MNTPNPESLRIILRHVTAKEAHGYAYDTFAVVGRDDRGRRIRKNFQDRDKAVAFVTAMRTKLLNAQTAVTTAVTRLTPDQLKQAEAAFNRLGDRYTLDQAVTYFVDNYAAPDEAVTLKTAVEKFTEGKDDVRKNTLRNLKSTLQRFRDHVGGDTELHTLTAEHIRAFIRSLRSKDGVSGVSKKTFNNVRNDVSSLLAWCMDPQRRWVAKNVARDIAMHDRHQLRKSGVPDTLSADRACKLMAAAVTHEPSLAKAYALMLFAGIRPDDDGELFKLARHPDVEKLINLRTNVIWIPAEVSKVKRQRKVRVCDALNKWLSLPGPILPPNADRHIKAFRVSQKLTPDVCRHSFCTYHVATGGSLADTALQSGNSEAIVRDHYADQVTKDEAAPFWRIVPDDKSGAVIAPEPKPQKQPPAKKAAPKKKSLRKR
jgi:integrase